MAKVKLLRDHNGSLAGQSVEIPEDQVNYYRSVKLITDGKDTISEQVGENSGSKQGSGKGRNPKSN